MKGDKKRSRGEVFVLARLVLQSLQTCVNMGLYIVVCVSVYNVKVCWHMISTCPPLRTCAVLFNV